MALRRLPESAFKRPPKGPAPKVIKGRCEVCGHRGGILNIAKLCGACCLGESAMQAEWDKEASDA